MRHQGKLYQWNDEKGFGFVLTDKQRKVFVHISAFRHPARRPREGDEIAFDLEMDDRQRLQATRIKLMGVKPTPKVLAGRARSAHAGSTGNQKSPTSVPVFPLVILMVLPVVAWLLPDLRSITAALAGLNLFTFLMYWKDKSAARKQQGRIPEANLHIAALLGGWPGSWMAQNILRHKTVKTSFRVTFWLTVVCNLAGTLILLRHFSYV